MYMQVHSLCAAPAISTEGVWKKQLLLGADSLNVVMTVMKIHFLGSTIHMARVFWVIVVPEKDLLARWRVFQQEEKMHFAGFIYYWTVSFQVKGPNPF